MPVRAKVNLYQVAQESSAEEYRGSIPNLQNGVVHKDELR
jgi:hypothetical protein